MPGRPSRRRTCSSARRRRRAAPARSAGTSASGAGHVAARAPQRQGPPLPGRAAHDAHHRVVGAGLDLAVVGQKEVGDRRQPLERVIVAERDRLVGHVAARHHERAGGEIGQQQVVQRRVGEHQPELGRARSDGGSHRRARDSRRQHDRALDGLEQPPLLGPERDERARGVRVGDHQRERLVLAVLATAQRGDGTLVGGVAGEMEAAESLDRDDRTSRAAAPRRTRSDPRRSASGRSGRRPCSAGPQRGQAFGCAWKRRSPGSSYSRRHSAHIANGAIVVSGRS